ncbi:uncharacterized protein LOC110178453 [Drosophila serrata]|uniref:uncharacterized protein LOC110178453 n=1 Tax=Drosophila serrata TaxID=7274 RepID=UPI000A1D0ECF|nr:uncharacterized protein LOC110178453 [Drosophila serrata]
MFLPAVHLLFFGLTATWAFQWQDDWPHRNLTWYQRQYYQSRWYQRLRFTTTPRPGATPEPSEARMVYPCYCFKPKVDGMVEPFEKRMIEPKELFFLN